MKTILYARVSTTDKTIAHQRTQAEAAGFKIDTVVADEGVSGAIADEGAYDRCPVEPYGEQKR